MGCFDEQIRQRKAADDEVFCDAFAKIASSVPGRHVTDLGTEHEVTEEAVNEILKHYHCGGKQHKIPDFINDFNVEHEYLLKLCTLK